MNVTFFLMCRKIIRNEQYKTKKMKNVKDEHPWPILKEPQAVLAPTMENTVQGNLNIDLIYYVITSNVD